MMPSSRAKSIGQVLDEHKSIGPGFDFLRVFLAFSIAIFHAFTCTNAYYQPLNLDLTPIWIVHYSLVPMFFALSGFLISGSASRLSLKNFLINRGLRIVPALAVDMFVCALVIGPIFTTVSLKQYFLSWEFVSFFLNITGWVHFTLPGVFMTHPVARVNGSLWTVPFELVCYFLISLLIMRKLVKTRLPVAAFVVSYLVAAVAVDQSGLVNHIHSAAIQRALQVVFVEKEAQAVTAFLVGIIFYQNRYKIPYSPILLVICVLAVLTIAFTMNMSTGGGTIPRFILIPALVYITMFVGLTPMWLPKFFKSGDYSYGIYLYHQPFLQIVISLFPAIAYAGYAGGAFTFIAGLPFIIGIAWLSWHLVEKPLLALRKRYTIVAKIRGVEEPIKGPFKTT